MKAVILAAGTGSRLDDSANHLPKALTRLSTGQSILQYQLDALSKFLSLDDVMVVVGYQKEAIMEAFPDLLYVYNPHFAQENTSKSLLRALQKINEDVLWLNGDVLFRPAILEEVFTADRTGMIVNQAVVGEEEVKYRTDPQGRIFQVSKQVEEAQGEALGINFFKKNDLGVFRQQLNACQPNDYFEKGIEKAIHEGVIVWSIPIEVKDCTEIDFPEDLIRANQLLQTWHAD